MTRKALVTFETPHAAETALLLSNAMIVDHAIHVELYKESLASVLMTPASASGPESSKTATPADSSLPHGSGQATMVTIEEVDEAYVQRNFGCTPDAMRVREQPLISVSPFLGFLSVV